MELSKFSGKVKSKYLTKGFLDTFVREYREAIGSENRYAETRKSDFYQLDSGNYCLFLEVFHSLMPQFSIRFYQKGIRVDSRKDRFLDAETAERWAKFYADAKGYEEFCVSNN